MNTQDRRQHRPVESAQAEANLAEDGDHSD
jgi:hypothetical protein